MQLRQTLKELDSWRLSADWISHSWTASPSLKEDLMIDFSVYHKGHPDGAVASSQDLQGDRWGGRQQ